MSKAVFVVDLARCTGCLTCSIACKDRAGLADELDWLRVDAHEGGVYPNPTLTYRVMHCFHCEEPSCAHVCPTSAIAKGGDGLVQIEGELCTACGACVEACPFSAMVMCASGTASKCDGCVDEVARGWGPTCVRACPMRALRYGQDATWPENRVADPSFEDHGIGPVVRFLRRP